MRSRSFGFYTSVHSYKSWAALIVVVLGCAVVGMGQRGPGVKVDAGKEVEFRLPFAFNRQGLGVDVSPGGLATVGRNTDDEFVVTGQMSGDGLITVTGTRDGVDAAGRNVRLPFRYLVPVRVLAPAAVDSKTRPISVGIGPASAVTLDVGYIMQPGQEFYRLGERGITWQGPFLVGGDSSIARGSVFVKGDQYKLRITGIRNGKTTLRLLGERRAGAEWRQVERIIPVTVGTGRAQRPLNIPASEPEPNVPKSDGTAEPAVPGLHDRDKVVKAIEEYYDSLQAQVLQDNYSDEKAETLLKSLEDIVALIDQELRDEDADSMDLSRRARLEKVKNSAKVEIEQLKNRLKKKTDTENPLAGKWILLENGQESGEVEFVENGSVVNITLNSQHWLSMRSGDRPVRILFVPIGVQVKLGFNGLQVIQLRGEAAEGRLEFWATRDLREPEFLKSPYTLVREDKLR